MNARTAIKAGDQIEFARDGITQYGKVMANVSATAWMIAHLVVKVPGHTRPEVLNPANYEIRRIEA